MTPFLPCAARRTYGGYAGGCISGFIAGPSVPRLELPGGFCSRAPAPYTAAYTAAYIAGLFAAPSVQYRAQCTRKCAAGAEIGPRVHCEGKCTARHLRFCRPYIRGFIAGFIAARNVRRPGQNARQCTAEMHWRCRVPENGRAGSAGGLTVRRERRRGGRGQLTRDRSASAVPSCAARWSVRPMGLTSSVTTEESW